MVNVYEFSEVCEVFDRFPKSGCGLKSFLTKINQEEKAFPSEKFLMENLKMEYLKAWNNNSNSRARGPSTGKAF